jgi:phage terminase large subunit-like protein
MSEVNTIKPASGNDKSPTAKATMRAPSSKPTSSHATGIPDFSTKPDARSNRRPDSSVCTNEPDALDQVLAKIRALPEIDSPAAWIASCADRDQFLGNLSDEDATRLQALWPLWARSEQLPPAGTWRFWLFRGGRGAGKTRAGAEWVRDRIERDGCRRVALVAPTMMSGRQVMIEGESGLLAICPSTFRPIYEPSRNQLRWPNGAVATLFSADVPERLRGYQHEAFWADELCAWRSATYAWDMLLLGLRLGTNPRGIITTTPKSIALYKKLLADPTVVTTTSSTYRNAANLAPEFLDAIIARYEGTRLGRQELNAEVVDDAEGALWRRAWLERDRATEAPHLTRIVVAIDPAMTSGEGAAETGIVVAGCDHREHVFVLEDGSVHGSPDHWARRAIDAYHRYRADMLVVEANQGGELVTQTLYTVDASVPVESIHASRGKRTRAEPVAALYEQGRVHHVGAFPELEDQLCLWEPLSGEISPDRLDALVWAISALGITDGPPLGLVSTTTRGPQENDRHWFRDLLVRNSTRR